MNSSIIQGLLGAAFNSKTEIDRMKDPKVQEEMKTKLMANAQQMQAMAAQMQQEISKNGKVPSAENSKRFQTCLP